MKLQRDERDHRAARQTGGSSCRALILHCCSLCLPTQIMQIAQRSNDTAETVFLRLERVVNDKEAHVLATNKRSGRRIRDENSVSRAHVKY